MEINLKDFLHNFRRRTTKSGYSQSYGKSPALIVADEPTGNLDKNNSKSVRELFKEIAHNATIIIATHDNDYLEIADKAYELNEGKLTKLNEHNI